MDDIAHQEKPSLPYQDHPQLPMLADIFNRQHCHHLSLRFHEGSHCERYFLDAFTHHLTKQSIATHWHPFTVLYFSSETKDALGETLKTWRNKIDQDNHGLLLAFSDDITASLHTEANALLKEMVLTIASHPRCRLLFFTRKNTPPFADLLQDQIIFLTIDRSNQKNRLLLLKQESMRLETFHNITIPAPLLTMAYALAEHYLNPIDPLLDAILLLDSASAQVVATAKTPALVTEQILISVLSHRTHLPLLHFEAKPFERSRALSRLQQKLHGQDDALFLLTENLHDAFSPLRKKTGPLCTALFAGPAHTGKHTLARALSMELFQSHHALYTASIPVTPIDSLLELTMQRASDQQSFSVREVIDNHPYAILLFENIERANLSLQQAINDIVETGYAEDANRKRYAFSRTFLLFTTTVAKEIFMPLLQEEEQTKIPNNESNLLSLIMRESSRNTTMHMRTTDEIIENIWSQLSKDIPAYFRKHVTLIPFFPLSKSAITLILQTKLEQLSHDLKSQHGMQFNYAPEVIRYLANLFTAKLETHIEYLLKPVYQVIERTLQQDAPTGAASLFLQLNDNGQLLRCDWLAIPEHHKE